MNMKTIGTMERILILVLMALAYIVPYFLLGYQNNRINQLEKEVITLQSK